MQHSHYRCRIVSKSGLMSLTHTSSKLRMPPCLTTGGSDTKELYQVVADKTGSPDLGLRVLGRFWVSLLISSLGLVLNLLPFVLSKYLRLGT